MIRILFAALLFASLAPAAAPVAAAPAHTGSLVGNWFFHDYSLEITATGNAYAVYRSFTFCTAHRRNGCDRIIGNGIYSGGLWYARLAGMGGGHATGAIDASADSSLDGMPLIFQTRPNDRLLMVVGRGARQQRLTLCGPHTPPSLHACGA